MSCCEKRLDNETSVEASSVLAEDGTAAAPSYSFLSDPDTGMYRSAANTIGFSTGGTQRMSISSSLISNELDTVIDVTSTEALLVRKNGDTGDIFNVNTTASSIQARGNLEIIPTSPTGAPGTSGVGLECQAFTFTDNSTAASGTAGTFAAHSLAQPTLAAVNTSVTTTNAHTLYIAGPPAAGANETITNPYSLFINSGNMRSNGGIRAQGTIFDLGSAISTRFIISDTAARIDMRTDSANALQVRDSTNTNTYFNVKAGANPEVMVGGTNAPADIRVVNNAGTDIMLLDNSTEQLLMDAENDPTNPAYSFIGDTDTGLYQSAPNTIGISLGGTNAVSLAGNTMTFKPTTQFGITDGTTSVFVVDTIAYELNCPKGIIRITDVAAPGTTAGALYANSSDGGLYWETTRLDATAPPVFSTTMTGFYLTDGVNNATTQANSFYTYQDINGMRYYQIHLISNKTGLSGDVYLQTPWTSGGSANYYPCNLSYLANITIAANKLPLNCGFNSDGSIDIAWNDLTTNTVTVLQDTEITANCSIGVNGFFEL